MKTVIITGASRGIGKATSEKFLKEGWKVIGTSTTGKSAFTHPNLAFYKLNLLNTDEIKEFADKIKVTHKEINALVNNAGISHNEDKNTISMVALNDTLKVNLIGLIDLTERLIPLMQSGCNIINISSGYGSIEGSEGAYVPAYKISKVALNAYTRSLAARLANKNIIVSSLNPGWVKTDMGGPGAPRQPNEPANEIYTLATSKVETGHVWTYGKIREW